jgi:hypothetical protein
MAALCIFSLRVKFFHHWEFIAFSEGTLTDNTFILIGMLESADRYYAESELGLPGIPRRLQNVLDASNAKPDERIYATFLVETSAPYEGGVHEVVATPESGGAAFYCLRLGVPALVRGTIRSFNRVPILVATYITAFVPHSESESRDNKKTKYWTLSKIPEDEIARLWHQYQTDLTNLAGIT